MKPTKKTSLTAALGLSMSLGVGTMLGNETRAAPAIQVPAVGYDFVCSSQLLDVREQGNNTVLTLFNRLWTRSEDDRIDGQAEISVEVSIDNVSGHVVAHGNVVLRPDAYPGSTWEAAFNLHAPGGKAIDLNSGFTIVKAAQVNARGTGVLAGQWFFFEVGSGPLPFPAEILALDPDGLGVGCEFTGEAIDGRILNPHGG